MKVTFPYQLVMQLRREVARLTADLAALRKECGEIALSIEANSHYSQHEGFREVLHDATGKLWAMEKGKVMTPNEIAVQMQKMADENVLRARIAELESDAALDKAELSRIRPNRGDPYFHSTVEEWAAECKQTADLRAKLAARTAELAASKAIVRDVLAVAEDYKAREKARTEERDAARESLLNVAKELCPGSPEDSQRAEVDIDAMGACQIIRRMREKRDAAQQRLHDAAKLMGVPDGGTYINDWKQAAEINARVRGERDGLAAALGQVQLILQEAPELNPSNYNSDELHALNDACIEAWEIVATAASQFAPILAAHDAAITAKAKAEGLNAFAGHIRNTWGQAYPTDIWPEPLPSSIPPDLRSVCSASMGRHMAAKIEQEVRDMAAQAEAEDHA